MRIKNEKELMRLLPEHLRKDYCIGIHGFDGDYWTKDENLGKYVLDLDKIEAAKKSILRDGLSFSKGRILLSTVRFSDLSAYISTREFYDAGGIIVALPKVLRTDSGNDIFLGYPDENFMRNTHWDRNREPISLSEILLPDEGRLDQSFILGTYCKDDEGIEVTTNPAHVSLQNGGLVSDDFVNSKRNMLREMLKKRKIEKRVLSTVEGQRLAEQGNVITSLGKRAYRALGTAVIAFRGSAMDVLGKIKSTKGETER